MRGDAPFQTIGGLVQITGTDATLGMFEQNAPGKRVLHIATHGFFLEGTCESAVQRKLDNRDERFFHF